LGLFGQPITEDFGRFCDKRGFLGPQEFCYPQVAAQMALPL